MPRSDLPETLSEDVDQLGATEAATATPHPLPRTIGRYELESLLGEGGNHEMARRHLDEPCP